MKKLKIGQKIIIIKKPKRDTNVEIGDLAVECGISSFPELEYQFHSTDLIDIDKKRENYWVEFLPKDCYQRA